MSNRVAVMGSGSWGTTFAAVLADAGQDVTIWGRRQAVVDDITMNHRNSQYLPGVDLPPQIHATTDPAAAAVAADLVICAVPAQSLRANLRAWGSALKPHATLVSLMKGIELQTFSRMSEVIADELPTHTDRIAVISGPNLAMEIAHRQPTATVVGAGHLDIAEQVAAACSTSYFRPYTNTDVTGIEIGGAVKNVIALAVGMAEGLGMGHNTQASLITRGLAETSRLAEAMGAEPATLAGLAGMGDLVATCASPLSRNRTVGVRLGRGESLQQIVDTTAQTAEGVKSCDGVYQLALRYGVYMPMVEHITSFVAGTMDLRDMAGSLLNRPRRSEQE